MGMMISMSEMLVWYHSASEMSSSKASNEMWFASLFYSLWMAKLSGPTIALVVRLCCIASAGYAPSTIYGNDGGHCVVSLFV